MNELSIKVNIAERFFPLTVSAHEEEKVRKAAKLINDKLKSFGNSFAVRDKQDILSMCALELATELIDLREEKVTQSHALTSHLNEIHSLLKDVPV
ncbi:MAG: cell division protein ZapA [Bacteroidia bacterium]